MLLPSSGHESDDPAFGVDNSMKFGQKVDEESIKEEKPKPKKKVCICLIKSFMKIDLEFIIITQLLLAFTITRFLPSPPSG